MGWVRYDSYTDKFIYEEDLVSITATTCTGYIQKPFEITEEAIEKIADAVVRILRANQTIDSYSYTRGFTDGRESMRKLFEQTEPQAEDEILREQCRAFIDIVKQTESQTERSE